MFVDDYLHFSKLVSGQTLLSAMVTADNDPERALAEISDFEKLLQEYKEKNHSVKGK